MLPALRSATVEQLLSSLAGAFFILYIESNTMDHTFFCIDGHTCGNPVRVVVGGAPALVGSTMIDRTSAAGSIPGPESEVLKNGIHAR